MVGLDSTLSALFEGRCDYSQSGDLNSPEKGVNIYERYWVISSVVNSLKQLVLSTVCLFKQIGFLEMSSHWAWRGGGVYICSLYKVSNCPCYQHEGHWTKAKMYKLFPRGASIVLFYEVHVFRLSSVVREDWTDHSNHRSSSTRVTEDHHSLSLGDLVLLDSQLLVMYQPERIIQALCELRHIYGVNKTSRGHMTKLNLWCLAR